AGRGQEGGDDRGRAGARRRRDGRVHRRPERRHEGDVRRLLRPPCEHVQVDRAAGHAVRGAGRRRVRPAGRRAVPVRRRRAGRHLPGRLAGAGRPAPVHHRAVHEGDRGVRPGRTEPVPVGPPPVEDPAEGGGAGGVRL
ncbi:MAG: Lipid A biosynthesis lauroyl acyltransferase, partial [uncultured Phycisphaerae bacterium]